MDALARVFETIASMPSLARERPELRPPVRIHVHDGHLVVYALVQGRLMILRQLGARQDWRSILRAADQ